MSQISATNFQASSHECVDVNFTDFASICSTTISSNKSLHVRIQGGNPTLNTALENEKIKHLELDLEEKVTWMNVRYQLTWMVNPKFQLGN